MRNLQECQAEVFRRSEQRMQARKRLRRRMQTTCLLLVLCLAACGACFLPIEETLPAAGKAEMQFFTENVLAYAGGGFSTDGAPAEYGSITVSGEGISHYYTSTEKVEDIIFLIDTIISAPETTVTTGFFGAIVNTHEITVATDEKWIASDTFAGGDFESFYSGCYISPTKYGCIITVTHTNGIVDQYRLIGSMLSNLTTGEVFHMTVVAHFALKDALGLLSD